MNNAALIRTWPWLLIGLALLFRFAPGIDLWFSGLFFEPQRGFFLRDALPVRLSYVFFRYLPFAVIPAFLWLLFASWRWGGTGERALRRSILFLLAVLLLGPGLLIHEGLKDNSGRARPAQTEPFGGERRFTPAFVFADQCEKNCAFVSGHAAMGFFFVAFAWVFQNRRWLLYGGVVGALVGLGRIMQGSHFLSDIVFSFVVVLLTALLCARWLLGRWDIAPE